MEHQDWSQIILNKQKTIETKKQSNFCGNVNVNENFTIDSPKNLGQLILQARNAKNKTQKILASEIGVSAQVLSRWENGKEVPSNSDISKIEKILLCKLPRTKKIKIHHDE